MPKRRSTVKTHLLSISAFCLVTLFSSTLWASDVDKLAEGQAAFNAGNYQLAFAKWSALATTGHSDAQVFIGLSYANGWGVEKNPKLASVWYQKAAKNENPSAQFLLGIYYVTGDDNQETATGLMWLRRAAANGDESAQRFLDKARARGWFKELEPAKKSKPRKDNETAATATKQRVAIAASSATDNTPLSSSPISGL